MESCIRRRLITPAVVLIVVAQASPAVARTAGRAGALQCLTCTFLRSAAAQRTRPLSKTVRKERERERERETRTPLSIGIENQMYIYIYAPARSLSCLLSFACRADDSRVYVAGKRKRRQQQCRYVLYIYMYIMVFFNLSPVSLYGCIFSPPPSAASPSSFAPKGHSVSPTSTTFDFVIDYGGALSDETLTGAAAVTLAHPALFSHDLSIAQARLWRKTAAAGGKLH